jgi:hypothetical protein
MLRWGSRGKCGRSNGRGHFDRPDGCDRSIMTEHRRCRSAFCGDRGAARVGVVSPGLLTVYNRIKLQVDLQADKSPIVVKGPFFP